MLDADTRRASARPTAEPREPTSTIAPIEVVLRVGLTLFLLTAAFAVTVVWVDPRGDFGTGRLPMVVLPDRIHKMHALASFRATGPVDGLVLGSSRSMMIDPAVLGRATGERYFNFAVTGGGPHDALAIYRWVRSIYTKPTSIVFGMDLLVFGADFKPSERLTANPELAAALYGNDIPTGGRKLLAQARLLKDAFTLDCLIDTARSLRLAVVPKPPGYSLAENGRLRYDKWDAERRASTFDARAHFSECADRYAELHRSMRALDSGKKAVLETLLREARSDDVRVTIWLTPLHPRFASRLRQQSPYDEALAAGRAYLTELRDRFGIRVEDLHDASFLSTFADGWYDCVHTDGSLADEISGVLATAR